jgi:hypothetical protein
MRILTSRSKVAERVYESSKSCTVLLYRGKNGLTFQQEIIRDIAPDSVLEIITPSLCFEADDDYILDEDVYSRLTSLLQTDTITATKKKKRDEGVLLINQDIYKISIKN